MKNENCNTLFIEFDTWLPIPWVNDNEHSGRGSSKSGKV